MKQNEKKTHALSITSSLVKHLLIGAGVALTLIIFFLATAGTANPEWPEYWRLKPLLVVPIAGAGGGFFFYIMKQFIGWQGGRKVLAVFIGLLGYLIALWLGMVLGLNGTYWN